MDKIVYSMLFFINKYNKIPTCEDIEVDKSLYEEIVRKCYKENLIDKEYLRLNILGFIDIVDNPKLGITLKGLQFLKDNDPLGSVEQDL